MFDWLAAEFILRFEGSADRLRLLCPRLPDRSRKPAGRIERRRIHPAAARPPGYRPGFDGDFLGYEAA